MKPAFFMFRVFPPPSSLTNAFSLRYGTRAGSTTDAGIVLPMKRVDGDIIVFNIVFHLGEGPIRERTYFNQWSAVGVFFHLLNLGSCHALFAPETRDPGIQSGNSSGLSSICLANPLVPWIVTLLSDPRGFAKHIEESPDEFPSK